MSQGLAITFDATKIDDFMEKFGPTILCSYKSHEIHIKCLQIDSRSSDTERARRDASIELSPIEIGVDMDENVPIY